MFAWTVRTIGITALLTSITALRKTDLHMHIHSTIDWPRIVALCTCTSSQERERAATSYAARSSGASSDRVGPPAARQFLQRSWRQALICSRSSAATTCVTIEKAPSLSPITKRPLPAQRHDDARFAAATQLLRLACRPREQRASAWRGREAERSRESLKPIYVIGVWNNSFFLFLICIVIIF